MATATVEWRGYTAFVKKLESLIDIDAAPLMEAWTDVITEDNRAGVLAGLDKDGNAMIPVKYRTGINVKTRFRKRTNPLYGRTRGQIKRHGPLASGLHGNLSTAEYKKLTGPVLAPRREESRVITNLTKLEPYREGGTWIAECTWLDVVDVHGTPFLSAHFNGSPAAHLPKRDLRGVRPVGREKCKQLLRSFIKAVLDK